MIELSIPYENIGELKTFSPSSHFMDMSSISIEDSDEYSHFKKAFVYIRNTQMKAKFDFTKCNYKQKEAALLVFIKERINVSMPYLEVTWLDILSGHDESFIPDAIMNLEEILKFRKEHSELIENLKCFIDNIPTLAMMHNPITKSLHIKEEFNEYQIQFSLQNFIELTKYDFLFMLIDGSHEGTVFDAFDPSHPEYRFVSRLLEMPFTNIITSFSSSNEEAIAELTKNIQSGLNI